MTIPDVKVPCPRCGGESMLYYARTVEIEDKTTGEPMMIDSFECARCSTRFTQPSDAEPPPPEGGLERR